MKTRATWRFYQKPLTPKHPLRFFWAANTEPQQVFGCLRDIHPNSLTWNLKMMVLKMIFLFQGCILRWTMLSFWGTSISHLWKRKIIFKIVFWMDMLNSGSVFYQKKVHFAPLFLCAKIPGPMDASYQRCWWTRTKCCQGGVGRIRCVTPFRARDLRCNLFKWLVKWVPGVTYNSRKQHASWKMMVSIQAGPLLGLKRVITIITF